jgi:hypothetical protein
MMILAIPKFGQLPCQYPPSCLASIQPAIRHHIAKLVQITNPKSTNELSTSHPSFHMAARHSSGYDEGAPKFSEADEAFIEDQQNKTKYPHCFNVWHILRRYNRFSESTADFVEIRHNAEDVAHSTLERMSYSTD